MTETQSTARACVARVLHSAARGTPGMVVVLLAALCCSWLCGTAYAGEPRKIKVSPGLFELRLDNLPTGADVSWEARRPLTLDYRNYESGAVFVSYATTGQLVVISDVIDWDARSRDKTTWIVTVEGTPPEPGPDPTPPPLPPGLAGEIYQSAKPIGDPAKCLKYAANYEVVSTEIAAGAVKSQSEARSRIVSLNEPLQSNPRDPRWKAVGDLIASKLTTAVTVQDVKIVFDAAVIGLRAAGGGT